MSLIQPLEWRYATKKFDAGKKLSAEQLDNLLKATQLSPSSFGLQHYRILVIQDPAIRQQLRGVSWGQSQVTDASHLIVFAAETVIDEAYVKNFIAELIRVRQVDYETMAPYEQVIISSVNGRSADQNIAWAHKQAYIALGVLMVAAAEAGIDACPMEGFDAGKYDEILGLTEKGLTASVICPVGFRAEDDHYSHFAKVRKPEKDLFIHI